MPTAPVKKHFTYTIKDFHNKYKKEGKTEVTYKKYRSIIKDFFLGVFKKIIYENFTFVMPYSLGLILVKAVKTNPKNLSIDFHQTKKTGKVVRHLNRHTRGYYFMIWWNKSHVRFKNNNFYCFKATRSQSATDQGIGKLALAKHIKDLSEDPEKRSFIRR